MTTIDAPIVPARRLPCETLALSIVGGCGVLLFGALIMEHGYQMVPCPLCLMQRIWFFVAGLFALIGLLHDPRWGIYPLLSIGASVVGGGFSIRQLYLQSLPPDQVPACAPDINYMIEVFPLADVIVAMTSGTGDCAVVEPFLGVPLPLWALLGFAAIIAVAVAQIRAGNQAAGR